MRYLSLVLGPNNENETSSMSSYASTSSMSSLDTQEFPSMSMFSDTPSNSNYQNANLVDPIPYRTGIVYLETPFTSSYRARSLNSTLESPLCREKTERCGIGVSYSSPSNFSSWSRVTKLASENKKTCSSRPVSSCGPLVSIRKIPYLSSYQQNTIESLNQGNKSKRHELRFTDAARKSTSALSGIMSPETPPTLPYRARSLTSSLESPLCREKTERCGIGVSYSSPSNFSSWSRVTKLASENKKSCSSRPVSSCGLRVSIRKIPYLSSYRQNTIESLNQGNKSKRHELRFTDAARKSTSAP